MPGDEELHAAVEFAGNIDLEEDNLEAAENIQSLVQEYNDLHSTSSRHIEIKKTDYFS